MTLPVPVILNRLATDFFVLMPFGRRINLFVVKRVRNIRTRWNKGKLQFQKTTDAPAEPLFYRETDKWQGTIGNRLSSSFFFAKLRHA